MRKKIRCIPVVIDLIYLKFFNIGNGRTDINPKNGHNSVPMGSPMARILGAP